MSDTGYNQIMDSEFVLTALGLEELKQMGYEEVWIGDVTNPHWPRHGCDNFVIAAPKRKHEGWPALWAAKKYFGKTDCGNGLLKADQSQKSMARKMTPGHYKLKSDHWERIN